MSLKNFIFKGKGRVAFGKDVLKNELVLHIKVQRNYQNKNFLKNSRRLPI